jgi:hypothetical protein
MALILEELARDSAKISNNFTELSKNMIDLNLFFWKIFDSKMDFFDELDLNCQVICKKIIEINIKKSNFQKKCNENKIGKYISKKQLLEYEGNHLDNLDVKQIKVQMISIYSMIYLNNNDKYYSDKCISKKKCLNLALNLIKVIKLSFCIDENYYNHISMHFLEKYFEKLRYSEHVEIALLQQNSYSECYKKNLDNIESLEKIIEPQTEDFFNQLSKIGITEEVIKTGSMKNMCRSSSGSY